MRTLTLVVIALICGCDIDSGTVRDPLGDDPPLADWSDAAVVPEGPADDAPPAITIDVTEEIEPGLVRLAGTTEDDRGVTAIQIAVGASGPYDVAPIGRGFGEWEATVEVPEVGPVGLRATAFDGMGNTGVAEAMLDRPMPDDDTPPTVTIAAPLDGLQTNVGRLLVEGTAEDDTAIARVVLLMEVDGVELGIGVARTADFFARWSLDAPVPPAAEVTYVVQATDLAGNVGEARARVVSRAAPPHDPPRLVASNPADGTTVGALRQGFRLTIEADAPLVQVTAGPIDGPLFEADPEGDDFVVDLALAPGENRLRVISRDADGLIGRDLLAVEVDDGWGAITPLALNAPGEPGGEVSLDLDKAGVIEMFPDEVKRTTNLIELDPGPMVQNALGAIRAACGRNWEGPHFANGAFLFDCPPEWGPAERNLWGLLTMTPANVNVVGTDLEGASDLALPILEIPFGEILALALGIEFEEVMLGDAPLVAAIKEALIGTHPNTTPSGALAVTLDDGLKDMIPLGERFDAVPGEHPGFIAGYVEAAVLTNAFRMGLTLQSNLRLYDGLDLEAPTKTYFADRAPDGPVVELEFLEIESFTLEGIAPAPEVAMDFRMVEADIAAVPGTSLLPIGRGDSDVWDFEPYLLEHVVALSSRYAFDDLRTGCDLCSGQSEGAALFLNPNGGTDFAEIAIGTVGYDCVDAADPDCTSGVAPNARGVAEHIEAIDALFCQDDVECPAGMECHPQNRCVPAEQNICARDRNCAEGELCLLGQCLPEAAVECRSTPECDVGDICYEGGCMPVPLGWFRLWMPPGVTVLPDPGYMWDVVLQVAQARLRDSGVRQGGADGAPFIDAVPEGEGDVVFGLEGVSVGLTDEDIEREVRQNLQLQRETLADALLGAYTDIARPVDVYLDRFGAGEDRRMWLMHSPCRVGRAHIPDAADRVPGEERCDADPDVGIYDSPEGGDRLDVPAPSGLRGVVMDDPAAPAPPTLYVRTTEGTHRLDVAEVEADRVLFWYRAPR